MLLTHSKFHLMLDLPKGKQLCKVGIYQTVLHKLLPFKTSTQRQAANFILKGASLVSGYQMQGFSQGKGRT